MLHSKNTNTATCLRLNFVFTSSDIIIKAYVCLQANVAFVRIFQSAAMSPSVPLRVVANRMEHSLRASAAHWCLSLIARFCSATNYCLRLQCASYDRTTLQNWSSLPPPMRVREMTPSVRLISAETSHNRWRTASRKIKVDSLKTSTFYRDRLNDIRCVQEKKVCYNFIIFYNLKKL